MIIKSIHIPVAHTERRIQITLTMEQAAALSRCIYKLVGFADTISKKDLDIAAKISDSIDAL